MDALDQGHRVGCDQALAVGPIQEARQGGLFAGAASRTEPFERGPEAADHLGGDAVDGTLLESRELREVTCVGAARVP